MNTTHTGGQLPSFLTFFITACTVSQTLLLVVHKIPHCIAMANTLNEGTAGGPIYSIEITTARLVFSWNLL